MFWFHLDTKEGFILKIVSQEASALPSSYCIYRQFFFRVLSITLDFQILAIQKDSGHLEQVYSLIKTQDRQCTTKDAGDKEPGKDENKPQVLVKSKKKHNFQQKGQSNPIHKDHKSRIITTMRKEQKYPEIQGKKLQRMSRE